MWRAWYLHECLCVTGAIGVCLCIFYIPVFTSLHVLNWAMKGATSTLFWTAQAKLHAINWARGRPFRLNDFLGYLPMLHPTPYVIQGGIKVTISMFKNSHLVCIILFYYYFSLHVNLWCNIQIEYLKYSKWLPSVLRHCWRRSGTLEQIVLQNCGLLVILAGTCSLKPDSTCVGTLPSQYTPMGSNFFANGTAWDVGIMVSEELKDVDRSSLGIFLIRYHCSMSQSNCVMHERPQSWFSVPTLKLGHRSWRTLARSSNLL